ncbi:E3 ubiquitin-protein ligase TRIM35-like [Festucalex cinctus]
MARRIEDDLKCPACLEIFKDPVVLPCSHSFCRACVHQWWEQKEDRTCPVCRTECTLIDVPSNLVLRNVCETLSQASVELNHTCSLHKENLKLFCLDHQELVCLICRDSKLHAGHKFHPVDEVVKEKREKLREALLDAKQRLNDYNEIRDNCNEQAAYIKVQRKQVESKIQKDFKWLHRFLRAEKVGRLFAVMEDEQKKTRMMKKKIEALDREMAALSDVIAITEEQLMSDPNSFMMNFQTVLTRIQELPDKPERLKGALLDEAKHVGNLNISVCERMKQEFSYSPVILDPNLADPNLTLSEDLTSVSCQEGQERPKNPERLDCNVVLGSALAFGTHTWDVEVGDNSDWGVGLAWGDPCFPDAMLQWSIAFRDKKYRKFTDPLGLWNPPVKLQRIQIHVDCNERSVSFSESLTNTELCKMNSPAWPHLSGSMKLFPYFWTYDEIPLQIIPLARHVTTQNQ